jgi:hypothetical protein
MGVVCMADNIVCLFYYTFEPNFSQMSFIIIFIHLHVVLDGQWVKVSTITNCLWLKYVTCCSLVYVCCIGLSAGVSAVRRYIFSPTGLTPIGWVCGYSFIFTDCLTLKPFITTDLPSVFSGCGIVVPTHTLNTAGEHLVP